MTTILRHLALILFLAVSNHEVYSKYRSMATSLSPGSKNLEMLRKTVAQAMDKRSVTEIMESGNDDELQFRPARGYYDGLGPNRQNYFPSANNYARPGSSRGRPYQGPYFTTDSLLPYFSSYMPATSYTSGDENYGNYEDSNQYEYKPQYSSYSSNSYQQSPNNYQSSDRDQSYQFSGYSSYGDPNYGYNSYDSDSYNKLSYDSDSYNTPSYDSDSYSRLSYDSDYNSRPFDSNAYNKPYDSDSYNGHSYDSGSYNSPSYNFDSSSYNSPSYNFDSSSYNSPSYNFDSDSYYRPSYDSDSYNRPSYDSDSYNSPSYNFDSDSYHKSSYDSDSYNGPSQEYQSNYNFDGYSSNEPIEDSYSTDTSSYSGSSAYVSNKSPKSKYENRNSYSENSEDSIPEVRFFHGDYNDIPVGNVQNYEPPPYKVVYLSSTPSNSYNTINTEYQSSYNSAPSLGYNSPPSPPSYGNSASTYPSMPSQQNYQSSNNYVDTSNSFNPYNYGYQNSDSSSYGKVIYYYT